VRKPVKKPATKPRVKREPTPPTSRVLGFGYELEGRKPIMFWTDKFDPNLFVGRADDVPAARKRSVVAKMKRGKLVQGYKGGSRCRICRKALGSRDLGNADWIWPEKAEHYITEHGVWFPLLDTFAGAAASAPARRRKKVVEEEVEEVVVAPPRRRRKKVEVEEAPTPAPRRRTSRATAEPAPASPRRRSGASAAFPTGGVMLAKKHTGSDVRGWWMSEKFDGMRAYWTGSELFSRNGNKVYAPKWFTDALPDMALDGELMLGRGRFQETMSIVRKQTPVDKDWRKITFHVFDAPMERGGCEARWDAAKRAVRGIGHVEMVEQVACKSPAHLKQVHDEIAALGGEGVMLREPGSPYEHRRSSRLLKVKMFDDNEARITGYEAGKGKHAGRLGAYEAVLTTGPHKGKSFTVGTGMSDEERERPLRIGTIITVKHQGYSDSGHPRFPSFLRVRGRE
jgi:DNA ligase-1